MISPCLRAEIRRLHTAEGWRPNTIARHLGVHHGTVTRALEQDGLAPVKKRRRPMMIDPFIPWIRGVFQQYPRLSAAALYEMARRRGYPGRPDHFRAAVRRLGLRPKPTAEAFLHLRTLPGEQAQVDWAYFGQRRVHGGVRKLWVFIMVLSYSRWISFRFFYDARMASFLTGHVDALKAFGGCPRVLLYDNLKSAVLERRGSSVRFHPRLLEMADHYGFEPRPVAPRRGNEKGRVERAIRYLRSSFFPLRQDWSLDALNAEAPRWCHGTAARRCWPQDRQRTVAQALAEERPQLLRLPDEPFLAHEQAHAAVRRSPYVRFDANRYSIPHDRVQRTITVLATIDRVRLFDREVLVAEHPRCWGKQQVIEQEEHVAKLWQAKRQARQHRGQDRLARAVPRSDELLVEVARRQRHLSSAVDQLLFLLDTYGAGEMRAAVAEAIDKGSPHPETVRLVLDRRARSRGAKPPIPIPLPEDPRLRGLVVKPHDLADYDPEETLS